MQGVAFGGPRFGLSERPQLETVPDPIAAAFVSAAGGPEVDDLGIDLQVWGALGSMDIPQMG
jgi:hypothetical protein